MTHAGPTRRAVLAAGLAGVAGVAVAAPLLARAASNEPPFRISLAQWSYHRAVQSGAMSTLDFPRVALRDHGIDAVEYVSTLFAQQNLNAQTTALRSRCDDLGVRSLLIMVDEEGALGDPDNAARARAVENHRKWLAAAEALGCHSIRVNAESRGGPDEQARLAADGLRSLCELADAHTLDVIVENHWGLSSVAPWLVAVLRRVDHPRIGALPDFGNFDPKRQDRYEGVRALMPYARAVSAKSIDFDDDGRETTTDYLRMMRIVVESGYRGHIGVEYEGARLSEPEGINATKRLLERVRATLTHEVMDQ